MADSIVCKEIYDPRLEVIRARTTVIIEQTADVTKQFPKSKYDKIYNVNVTIKSTLRGQTTIVDQFKARAVSEDVEYRMVSAKPRVSFYVYLDEMDQAGVLYRDESGRYRQVNLNCSYGR